MKSFFTKLSVLLFGVAFAVAGCQDYDEDIRKVNEQLNNNTAELTSITDALDKAIKDLEAKMVADYATKKALADLSAELKAEIDADVAAAKTALEAAYKAADAALKSGYEAADAALKAELQNKINEAVKAAQDANDALADTFEKALNQMKGSIDETNSMINDVLVPYFQGEIAKVNDAISKLTKTVGDLDAAYKAADAGLQKNIDAAIAKAAADLLAAKTELTAAYEAAIKTAVDKLQAEITKNSEAIAALTTLHKNDVALLQAAIAENSDDITALLLQLNEFKSEYKTTVDLLQGAIAEGDEAVRQQLTNALNAHIEVYEETVDLLQGAIAEGDEAVRQQLTNAINALDELHKADVANLQGAIAENTTLAEGIRTQLLNHIAEYKATIEQLENQVTANEGEITMLKVRALAVEAQVEALQALHATDMENMQNVLNNLEVAIQQETAQRQAAIEELDAKHTLANEEILAYVGELEHQIRLNAAAIKNINDVNAAQDKAIEDLGKQLETLRKELKEYYALKTDVTTTKEELNKLIAKVAQLEKDAFAKINDINSRVNQNTEDLKKAIEAIAGLRVDVDKLLGRIQSVVYVPTHDDSKARVQYAVVGTEKPEVIQSNKNVIEYKVFPASAAKEIATAYTEGDENISLSFLVKGVTVTKAAPEYIVIEEVFGNEKSGILTIHYSTNFDAKFFPVGKEASKSYSAALVIENKKNDEQFSTEYTNFIAGDYLTYTLGLMYTAPTNGLKYKGETLEYDITYTDREVYPVLDNVIPVFYGGPVGFYTIAEFEYAYGSVPTVVASMTTEPKETKTFVSNFDAETFAATVQLADAVNLQNVGEELDLAITYTAGGDEATAYANVEVVGVKVNYAVNEPLTATWAYEEDAASDAGAATHRTFEVPVADITVDNILANTSLKDILAATPTSIVITSNDVEVESEAIALSATTETMTVEFDNFKWNATYNVVATYDLNYAKVKIEFVINTVDRERGELIIELGSTSVDYVKNLEIKAGTYNYPLQPVIDRLVELGNLDGDYAEDIFVNHIVEANGYSKYDAANPETALTATATPTSNDIIFDFQNEQFSFRYNYSKLDAVYPELIFTATFTTWYGQKVTIKHKLALVLPVYDFAHTTYYVKVEDGNYFSQVMGVYNPEVASTAIESFTVNNIDMNRAFNVVDANGVVVDELAEIGLATEFVLEGTYDAGITVTDNVITYNGKDDYVDVLGKLYIVNDNGTKIELPTSFATTYAGYIVKKYDPIGELKATDFEQKIEDRVKYNIPVLKHFSLKDSRNFVEQYELIDQVNGTWVIGDSKNGFAPGVTPTDVYGLVADYAAVTIPAGYEDIISFKDGVLTFDNTNNLAIVEDIVIDITFTINYLWGDREATVKCTFPKNI